MSIHQKVIKVCEISAYLLSIFFLADRLAILVHFLCVPKVVQLSEIDSEIENITWPRGDADLRTLTILPWVSRCFNFSHGLTTRLPISRFFGKYHSENSNEMLLR